MTKKERTLPNGYDLGPLKALLVERNKLLTDIEELTQHMANLEDQIQRAVESGGFDDEEGVKQVNVKRTQREMCTYRIEKWEKRTEAIEQELEQKVADITVVVEALAQKEIKAITAAAEAAILPFMNNRLAAHGLARSVHKVNAVAAQVSHANYGDTGARVSRAMCALERWLETGSLIVWPPSDQRARTPKRAEEASEASQSSSVPYTEEGSQNINISGVE